MHLASHIRVSARDQEEGIVLSCRLPDPLAQPASSHPPGHSDIGAFGGFNHCTAVLSGHFRSLLAQFGLTPKSKRGLAASDPGGAVDPLDAL